MASKDIQARGILVALRIRAFSGRKFDRTVTKETTQARGASADAGRWNKNLFPGATFEVPAQMTKAQQKKANAAAAVINKSNSHTALMQHIAAMRKWHEEQTLAWGDGGERLLPIDNYHPYMDGIREGKHKFDSLLKEFVREYPYLKAKAKQLLNGDFRESEYPTNIEERFSYKMDPRPIPEHGDYHVELTAKEVARLEKATEERVRDSVREAQNDAVKRLYTALSHIHERLSGSRVASRKRKIGVDPATGEAVYNEYEEETGKIFRDTLITNARELVDILKKLDISDDGRLEEFRRETELLAMVDPKTLQGKKNADVRAETSERAEDLLGRMEAAFGKDIFA